jgi:hypothetical protein
LLLQLKVKNQRLQRNDRGKQQFSCHECLGMKWSWRP